MRTNRVDSAGTGWSSSIIAGVHLLRRGSIVTGAGGPVIAATWSPPPQSTHTIIETVERDDYLLFQVVLPCTYLSTTVPSGHTHVGLLLSEHLGLFAPFWKTLNGLPRLWQETRASNTDKTTASVLIMLLVQTPAVNCAGLSCFRVWEFGRNVL